MKSLRLFIPSLLLLFGAPRAQEMDSINVIQVQGSNTKVRIYEKGGREFYEVSFNGGVTWSEKAEARKLLMLRYAKFDPLLGEPLIPGILRSRPGAKLFLVQFKTQCLEAYCQVLKGMGAEIHSFMPYQAYLVRMAPSVARKVEGLPFVRWVGRYHPAYRLEEGIIGEIMQAKFDSPPRKYNIVMVDEYGPDRKRLVEAVKRVGGKVDTAPEENILIEATLSLSQVLEIANEDTVQWIDIWSEGELDMDNARIQGGANYIEPKKPARYTGKGIRGMVMEGIYATHPEFGPTAYRGSPIVLHDGRSSWHGSCTFSEIFAKGISPRARGLLPDGQGIYCNYYYVINNNRRYQVVKELVDPNKKYRGMFQTASWGYARTLYYTSRSAEMDKIIFDLDIPITQSQSNAGGTSQPRMSRPQAWAKNIISVGGVRHYNNSNPGDDRWGKSGSTGPAMDGRIKPDLCAYYDYIYVANRSSGYYSNFGGTSGATPIVCGYAGLSIELYTDGIFGHPMPGGAAKRFENRPHFSVTKGMLINTARQYKFPGYKDFTRFNQGWGFPNVQDMWDLRNKMHIVNEWDVLKNLESKYYWFFVKAGEPQFRVTMIYPDPQGNPSSAIARINNLDLQVIAPNGTGFYGNHGLKAGNYSTPGGSPDTKDTVENVFIKNPVQGIWGVKVRASELNQDGHKETLAKDADYALIASGIASGRDRSHMTLDFTTSGNGDLKVSLKNFPSNWYQGWTFLSLDGKLPKGLGSALGIEPDDLTVACAGVTGSPGLFIHFTYTTNKNLFPYKDVQFPPGTFNLLKGKTLDGVTLIYDKSWNLLDVSNATRVKF